MKFEACTWPKGEQNAHPEQNGERVDFFLASGFGNIYSKTTQAQLVPVCVLQGCFWTSLHYNRHPKSIKAPGRKTLHFKRLLKAKPAPLSSFRTPASDPGPPWQIPLPHPGRILGPQAAHSAVARAELHLSVVLRRDPSGMKPAASAKTTASRLEFGISGQCFRFLSNQYERTLSDPVQHRIQASGSKTIAALQMNGPVTLISS